MTHDVSSDAGIMTPLIVFQCHHCRLKLQVPIFYAGQTGPCPQCGRVIQTPVAFPPAPAPLAETRVAVPPNEASEPPAKRWADPTSTFASEATALTRKSIGDPMTTPRSLNRGIIADAAIHRGDEMKKEGRQATKMLLWFIAVLLLVAAATYIMNAFVIG